jgi:hypothetical protein
MKFFDRLGRLGRSTRAVSGSERLDPSDQQKTIEGLSKRIAELEARLPQDAVEFEVDVVGGQSYKLNHGFRGPYRWYVTYWVGGGSGPGFTTLTEPTEGTVELLAHHSGKAVVRIEPSSYGLSKSSWPYLGPYHIYATGDYDGTVTPTVNMVELPTADGVYKVEAEVIFNELVSGSLTNAHGATFACTGGWKTVGGVSTLLNPYNPASDIGKTARWELTGGSEPADADLNLWLSGGRPVLELTPSVFGTYRYNLYGHYIKL